MVCVTVCPLDGHLGNGTSHRTVTMVEPRALTSQYGPVRYEAVLHRGGTSLVCACACGGGAVPTCDGAYSSRFYSAASLGHQATRTMTCYPTHSHYPDTEPTSPDPMLIMPSARLSINFKGIGLTHLRFEPVRSPMFGFPNLPE